MFDRKDDPVPGKKAKAKPYPIDAAVVEAIKPQWAESKPAPINAAAVSNSQSVR